MRKNIPVVSIVIPTKDRPQKLLKLLHSISKSHYKHFEVIIVNDSDKKLSILSPIKTHVKIIQNDKTRGLAFSRNQGAFMAKGKYVLFIDDDNYIDSHMIENLLSAFKKMKHIVGVGPRINYLSDKKRLWFISGKVTLLTSKAFSERTINLEKIHKNDLYPTEILHNCFMIEKKYGDEVGWFDEKIFMGGTEFDMVKRISKKFTKSQLVTSLSALCYHDVPVLSHRSLRSMGFENTRRVFYFQRNRGVLVSRYGSVLDKLSLGFLFYPFFTVGYGLLFLSRKRFDFLIAHLHGTIVGYGYLLGLNR